MLPLHIDPAASGVVSTGSGAMVHITLPVIVLLQPVTTLVPTTVKVQAVQKAPKSIADPVPATGAPMGTLPQ